MSFSLTTTASPAEIKTAAREVGIESWEIEISEEREERTTRGWAMVRTVTVTADTEGDSIAKIVGRVDWADGEATVSYFGGFQGDFTPVTSTECRICKRKIERAETFLMDTGDGLIQLGSTCAGRWRRYESKESKLAGAFPSESGSRRRDLVDFMARCAASIRDHGLVGAKGREEYEEPTSVAAWKETDAAPTDADYARAEQVRDIVLANLPSGDFGRNLGAALRRYTVGKRDIGIVASAFGVAQRIEADAYRASLPASHHLGQPKERLTLTVRVLRANVRGDLNAWGTSVYHRTAITAVTPDGALVEWWAKGSRGDLVGQDVTIRGTVKAHGTEWRGTAALTKLQRVTEV